MKRIIFLSMLLISTLAATAKNIQTVVFTTNPVMHCENCENKIKGNLRFEKGVKTIATDVTAQRVTVTYDADKTSPAKLQQAFEKFGYKATIVTDDTPETASCCGTSACQNCRSDSTATAKAACDGCTPKP